MKAFAGCWLEAGLAGWHGHHSMLAVAGGSTYTGSISCPGLVKPALPCHTPNTTMRPHLDAHKHVWVDASLCQRRTLGLGAGVPVQQPAVLLGVWLRQPGANQRRDQFIWHQVTAVHVLLCLQTT